MPEYAEIAKARIGAVKDYEATLDTKTIIKESIKEDKEKELGILNIFDFMGGRKMIYTKSVPRKWSKEEENKVIELKKQGKSNLEIAEIMDRTEVAIQIKLKRLKKKR
jgi:DNA-binding NarL/FixJ family response regulator